MAGLVLALVVVGCVPSSAGAGDETPSTAPVESSGGRCVRSLPGEVFDPPSDVLVFDCPAGSAVSLSFPAGSLRFLTARPTVHGEGGDNYDGAEAGWSVDCGSVEVGSGELLDLDGRGPATVWGVGTYPAPSPDPCSVTITPASPGPVTVEAGVALPSATVAP